MASVFLDVVINAKVDNKFKNVDRQLAKVDRTAQKTEKSFSALSGPLVAAGAAIAGIGTALSAVVSQAIVFEDLQTQFIAFTGSAESAAEQLDRLAEISASTPFQLEDLATANRSLLAFGSGTEESIEQLKFLGEAAAATGSDIGELATIFGQIQAAGKLTGERFLQLAERGVNIGPVLAESLGVAESQLEDLRKQGKITADDVEDAFRQMAGEGGIFAGSLERQSKTLSGSYSTLADNTKLLAANIGQALTPALVSLTTATTEAVKVLNKGFEDDKIDTTSGRIEFLRKQIDRADQNAEQLQKQLDRIGDAGDNAARRANFERISGQLEKVEFQSVRLREEFQRLSQAQQAATGREREEKEKEDLAKKVAEQNALEQEEINKQNEIREQKEKEITDKILALRQQQAENIRATQRAGDDEELARLDERGQAIAEKITEQQALLLENQNQFDEAERVRVEAQEAELNAIRANAIDEAKKIGEKARKDEFDFEKQTFKARVKFEQQTYAQRAQTAQRGLAVLASLQQSGSKQAFEVGKAAAIAQALVSIPATAIEAYKSLAGIPVVGPGLGAAAAAAAVVAGTAQVNRIRSQQFTGFQEGGLVTGGIPGRDSVPALLTPGEVVVPEKNFESLKVNNDEVVSLLASINSSINSLGQNMSSAPARQEGAVGSQPVMVELTLDGQVLANQILELNQDNQRIA